MKPQGFVKRQRSNIQVLGGENLHGSYLKPAAQLQRQDNALYMRKESKPFYSNYEGGEPETTQKTIIDTEKITEDGV